MLLAGCITTSISGSTGQSNGSSSGAKASGISSGTGISSGGVAGSTGEAQGSVAGATGGSSNGTGSGSGGDAGATTGNTTGPATGTGGTGGTGACLPLGDTCPSNAACCSGACNGTCQQPAGQACLRDGDCSSENCVNKACGCSASKQEENEDGQLVWVSGTCASDADCCNGNKCVVDPLYQSQTGLCCNTAGGACETNGDCCGGDCENGSCACVPSNSYPKTCQLSTDCCDGVCSQEHLAGGGYCLGAPGQTCDAPYECANANCSGGTCGTCALSDEYSGECTTTADCCPGLMCGTQPEDWTGEESATPELLTTCCTPEGTACDPTYSHGADGGICCGECSDAGACICIGNGGYCRWEEGCCPGAACLFCSQGVPDRLGCCQVDGQECFSDDDCCGGNCSNEQCACLPFGSPCSPQPGIFAQAGAHACCSGQCNQGGTCL